MKVLRYIQAVVSGKIKHQNVTERFAVDNLQQAAEKLRHPNSIVFKNFIVSSGIVIDSLVWEIRGPGISEVVDINTKGISLSITLQQIQELYTVFC